MTDTNKQDEKKGGVNPVGAVIAGAVVGVGVAVAGAVALSDKHNRDKVKKALDNVKDQAIGYMEDIKKQAQDKKDKVQDKLAEGKKEVRKVTSAAKRVKKTAQKK